MADDNLELSIFVNPDKESIARTEKLLNDTFSKLSIMPKVDYSSFRSIDKALGALTRDFYETKSLIQGVNKAGLNIDLKPFDRLESKLNTVIAKSQELYESFNKPIANGKSMAQIDALARRSIPEEAIGTPSPYKGLKLNSSRKRIEYGLPDTDARTNAAFDAYTKQQGWLAADALMREKGGAYGRLGRTFRLESIYGNEGYNANDEMGGIFSQLPALQQISNPVTRRKLMQLIGDQASWSFKSMPASTTGKYHPFQTNVEGGLVQHTNLVAQQAAYMAANMGLTDEQIDNVVGAALIHDLFKYDKSGHSVSNHAELAQKWAEFYGLKDIGAIAGTHMGEITGGYGAGSKGPDPTSPLYQEQKALHIADLAASRTSASEYIETTRPGDISSGLRWKRGDIGQPLEDLVTQGYGKWIDPKAAHTLDNFEEIVNVSTEETDTLDDWNDKFKSILGSAAALSTIIGKVAKTGFKIDAAAAETIKSSAEGMPIRYWAGLSMDEVLKMRVGSKYLSLPENTVYSAVMDMTGKIGSFTSTGTGLDLLSGSFLNGIDAVLANADNPLQAWNSIMNMVLGELPGASGAQRAQLMTFVSNYLGEGSANILGRIMDFNATATDPANRINSIYDIYSKQLENPYYNSYGRVAELEAKIAQLEGSIGASKQELANLWMENIGIPIRETWDQFLKQYGVPWIQRVFTGFKEGIKDHESQADSNARAAEQVLKLFGYEPPSEADPNYVDPRLEGLLKTPEEIEAEVKALEKTKNKVESIDMGTVPSNPFEIEGITPPKGKYYNSSSPGHTSINVNVYTNGNAESVASATTNALTQALATYGLV